jgi:NTE family protein
MSVAFVLSGGGSLGAVQVGMVHALYERGIRPDFWVGTSVGALNAAYLAARPAELSATTSLAQLWASVRRGDVFPLRPVAGFFGFFGAQNHLVPAGPLNRLVHRHVGLRRLEQSRVPVHVVATELVTGRERLLSQGPAAEAVMASISVPGVLPPVPWEEVLLVDGGVSNNTPLSHAVALGATQAYVLPAGGACELEALPQGALGMLLHALTVMLMRHLQAEIERFRDRVELVVMPPPCPQHVQPSDFSQGLDLVLTGLVHARRHLDALERGEVTRAALLETPWSERSGIPPP